MPRVTVLVPVYNGADLVGGAVESVLAQTFADFELLVVDDCSEDGSADVVRSFADPRIRVHRNERNLGQIETLNVGLREARGAYVARLDQDDRCLPTRLERQVAVLDAEPQVALVATWMDFVDDDGNLVGRLAGRLDDFPDFVFAGLTHELGIGHPSVMFRREAVLAIGGYDASVALAEDNDLWRRLALARHEARVVPEPLTVYGVHEHQQSNRHADAQLERLDMAVDRFVEGLSSRVEPRPLQLLLRGRQEVWDDCRTRERAEQLARSLELLLADAADRLRLAPHEQEKLERLVRRRVYDVARASWRRGPVHFGRVAPPFVAFGLVALPPPDRRARRRAYLLVLAGAPLLQALRLLRRAPRRTGR